MKSEYRWLTFLRWIVVAALGIFIIAGIVELALQRTDTASDIEDETSPSPTASISETPVEVTPALIRVKTEGSACAAAMYGASTAAKYGQDVDYPLAVAVSDCPSIHEFTSALNEYPEIIGIGTLTSDELIATFSAACFKANNAGLDTESCRTASAAGFPIF